MLRGAIPNFFCHRPIAFDEKLLELCNLGLANGISKEWPLKAQSPTRNKNMFLSGEESVGPVRAQSPETTASEGEESQSMLSPSIQRTAGENTGAFEVKFLIPEIIANHVQTWADGVMHRDAYADPSLGGAYQTTTLYLDTPDLGVFNRVNGHRKTKYRLRRYGSENRIYLERKTRQKDRVSKRRCDVPIDELPHVTHANHVTHATHATHATGADHAAAWAGVWFRERVTGYLLAPSCRITYDRCAFVKAGEDGPLRLTLDRNIRGYATKDWDLTPVDEGHAILRGEVICEFKFRVAMPNIFKELIQLLKLETGSVSKYRRMMLATGLVPLVVAAEQGQVNA